MPQVLSDDVRRQIAISAALGAKPDPDQAVRLVQALIQSAASVEGNAITAEFKLVFHEDREQGGDSINVMGLPCVVCGQVCAPIIGCVSICLVPPGGSC